MARHFLFLLCFTVLLLLPAKKASAQFNFNSGPIPMCDTSVFTANVNLGTNCFALTDPMNMPSTLPCWMCSFIAYLRINITTNHPQTLIVYVTAPSGDTLLLSAYNGAGGSNFTNTNFTYGGNPNITTGSAPFTGSWTAQGGSMSKFDGSSPCGNWTVTVIDTACAGGTTGSGSPWVPGTFGGSGAGASAIAIGTGSPPCQGGIPDDTIGVCIGQPVNIAAYYAGFPNYLITIYEPGGNVCPNPAAATIPGIYQIEAFDPFDGCVYLAYFTLNVYPNIALGPDQTIDHCLGNPIDLTSLFGIVGATQLWTHNGAPIPSATAAAATVSGTYEVIDISPLGCNDTASVALNILPAPNLGADMVVSICQGTTYDLTTLYNTTGLAVDWSLNGNPVANPAAVTQSGSYMLVVTDLVNGCTDTAMVNLTAASGIFLGPDQNITGCVSGAYNLTQLYNTTGMTTSWYLNGNPVANPSAVVINGNYVLVASDPTGCTDTSRVALLVFQKPNLGPDQTQTLCSGGSVNLTTLYTTGPNTPAWYFGGAPFATPASATNAGVYMLIVTAPNGCTDTAEVTLNVNTPPSLGPDQTQSICANETLDLTTFYSTTGYTASWQFNGNPVANPAGVSAAGTYVLIASAGAGCSDTAQVMLTQLATPQLGPDQTAGICSGDVADLTILFNTIGFTTDWTLAGTPVGNPASINTAGTYQLIATSPAGCSDTALAVVNVGTYPVIGPDQQLTQCSGTSVDLTGIYNTAGNTVSWTTAGSPVPNPSAATTSGVYTIVVTNAAGCSSAANVTLTFDPKPDLGPDQSAASCSGSAVNLTAFFTLSGLTAAWTENGNAVADPTAVSAAGSYQLIATNAYGCADTAVVTVSVYSSPALGPDQSHLLCQWQTLDLSGLFSLTGLTASYTFNGTPLSAFTAVHDSGVYAVNVTDANGCTDQALVIVANEECICDADFTFDAGCIQEPVSFEIVSDSVIVGALWTFGNGAFPSQSGLQPSITLRSEDSLLVTLEATLTCGVYTVSKYVEGIDCSDSCRIYIPNAFTPNRDGYNDIFSWKGECVPEEYYIEIYNRFGQVVFRSDDPLEQWDGKYNDMISPEGVYVFKIDYKLPYQFKEVVSGKLYVIR